jgi:hypothetical protein
MEAPDMMHKAFSLMAAAGVLGLGVSSAVAQPKEAPAAPAAATANAPDPEMTAVATALTGSWKASIPGTGGAVTEVVMNAAPVSIKDMPGTVYAELARPEALNRPYRQAIWQLHRVNGKLRLKTMEFRRPRGAMESAVGAWAMPEVFPAVAAEDLVTTLDVELAKAGNGWKGHTPHPYPTSVGGAVEMTSEISIGDTFTTADRGMDATGKVVWGPASEEGYVFKKFDAGVKAQRRDGGLVVIDYPAKTQGEAPKAGDKVLVQYSMYLADGRMIDSSYERGEPWTYFVGRNYSRSVEGWKQSLSDAKKGSVRRLVIPGSLGIPGGDAAAKVPANATLYVDCQIVDVVSGAAPTQPMVQPVQPGQPGQQVGPDFKKMEAEVQKKAAEMEKKKAEEAAKPGAPK